MFPIIEITLILTLLLHLFLKTARTQEKLQNPDGASCYCVAANCVVGARICGCTGEICTSDFASGGYCYGDYVADTATKKVDGV